MDEVGVPGLHIPWWQGLWAPKGTRNDIIAKLNGAVVKALIDPKVSRLFSELGLEIPSDEQRTPEGVRAFHKNDIEKWLADNQSSEHQGGISEGGLSRPLTAPMLHRTCRCARLSLR